MSTAGNLFESIVGDDPVLQGLAGGFVIALLNLVGALLVLVWRNPSRRALNTALGFAAGVMLAASFTSLILPGIERGGILPVFAGIALGAVVLAHAESWAPRVQRIITGRLARSSPDPPGGPGGMRAQPSPHAQAGTPPHRSSSATVLFVIAITLHNMPEGLAVGVGFGSGDIGNAVALMLAIGIQNIPEGLAVAVSARNAGMGSMSYAAVTGARAGAVEIPLAVFGAALVAVAAPLLPYAMGFAAGGMLYVISHEIIPQTQEHGRERLATLGLIVGAMLMLALDVALA